jgi:hypothetical protein
MMTSVLIPSLIALLAGMAVAVQPEADRGSAGVPGAKTELPAERAKAEVAAAQPITSADDLLGALETADAELRTLTAKVQYDKISGVAGDRQIRRGSLYFEDRRAEGAAGSGRRFAVNFDELQLGNRLETEDQQLIFDGQWLVEVNPRFRQIIRRQIVAQGDTFDPLKIGEGPLPLPIGQRRDETLKRFTATLLPDAAELEGEDETETQRLRTFVKGSYQLKLVPKPGTPEAEKYTEIRLWYREGPAEEGTRRLLPRMARTVAPKSEDVTIVRLIQVRTNVEIDPAMMATTPPSDGWDVITEALAPAASRSATPNVIAPDR